MQRIILETLGRHPWSSHIGRVVGNANRSLGYIRRNIKRKSKDVRESAYNTIVRPQLEYASAVWDLHTKEHISKIEMVQRRAARWTFSNFDNRASVTEMLKNLDGEHWNKDGPMLVFVFSTRLSMGL